MAVLGGLFLVAAPPAQAQYDTSCGFILDPPAVPVGGQVHIIGSGFGPEFTATFFIAPADNPEARTVLGTATSSDDLDGNIDATFSLPAGFEDGQYLITVECPEGDVASNVLIVGAGAPTTAATTAQEDLPVTGSDLPVTLARVALVALAVGGIILLVARRRHSSTVA
jgi:hypothetical protein